MERKIIIIKCLVVCVFLKKQRLTIWVLKDHLLATTTSHISRFIGFVCPFFFREGVGFWGLQSSFTRALDFDWLNTKPVKSLHSTWGHYKITIITSHLSNYTCQTIFTWNNASFQKYPVIVGMLFILMRTFGPIFGSTGSGTLLALAFLIFSCKNGEDISQKRIYNIP